MSVLNKNKAASIVLAVVIIGASGYFIYRSLSGGQPTSKPQKAYFTTDEGATRFVDDIRKLTPFDHEGKPALRLHVFKLKGQEVNGYLERFPEKTKDMIEASASDPDKSVQAGLARKHGFEVRAMNGTQWVPVDSKEGNKITALPGDDPADVQEIFP